MQWNKVRKVLRAAGMVLVLGLLAGCGQSKVQIGWVASNRPGHFEARYETFHGSEVRRVRLDAGEMLVLSYDAQLRKGTLSFSIEDPDGTELWDASFEEDAQGVVELPVQQDGRYAIVVRGDDTGGSFDLSWEEAP